MLMLWMSIGAQACVCVWSVGLCVDTVAVFASIFEDVTTLVLHLFGNVQLVSVCLLFSVLHGN